MERKEQSSLRRLPIWMKMERAGGESYLRIKKLVKNNQLHTICTSGNCPNIGECWNAGQATFMILGNICTRSCKFCMTITGKPLPPDPMEASRLAESIKILKLKHCVITSVDRDDLPDSGASFWAVTINKVREVNPETTIETLIPDFDGKKSCLDMIIKAQPEIISHNLETVRRLTPVIRSKARYDKSLKVINYVASKGIIAKSGIMLGLGEEPSEVLETMDDLLAAGCTIMTLGQYLRPSLNHMDVKEFVHPDKFKEYKTEGIKKGFVIIESGPLVRSSFHAEDHVSKGRS